MTKKQKAFFNYLQKLKSEERKDTRFVETALKEFFRYWELYEKQGMKDSMTVAMESTEAFVGLPVRAHLNSEVKKDDPKETIRKLQESTFSMIDEKNTQIKQLDEQGGQLLKEKTELEAKLENIRHYLDHEIPHYLINEATTKIYRMI